MLAVTAVPARPVTRAILFAVPLVLAALCVLATRLLLGFQFPVPWPDETGFVSPAYNLAHTGSLFDPGLNPDRVMMWMPPGYMLVLAGAFRVFGYSFALTRWLSAALVLASLALVARLAWRTVAGPRRVAAAWAVGAAFATPYMIVDGNVARMEPLLCCLLLLALTAGLAGRTYWMASIVAGSALVHFNAVYAVPAVVLWAGLAAVRGQLARPTRSDWVAICTAALCLGAYGVYVGEHWSGFADDMQAQFAMKAAFGRLDHSHSHWITRTGYALLLAGLVLRRRWDATVLPGLFGAGFIAMSHYGHEVWYDYGPPLGSALLVIFLLSDTPATHALRTARLWLSAAAAGLLVLTGFTSTPEMRQLLPTAVMFERPFVTSANLESVRAFLRTRPPGQAIDFGMTGMECFFLPDLARAGLHWTLLQHDILHQHPYRSSDWRVACDSSDLTPEMRQFDLTLNRKGVDSGCKILPGLDPSVK